MNPENSLSNYIFNTYTLIYLIHDKRILLLQRDSKKNDMAGKLTGLGGKIEHGEALLNSAKRECFEESGLTINNPQFRGTFQWFDESNKICMTHIIFAYDFSGSLEAENREGILKWFLIEELNNLENLAAYQKMFLNFLLSDNNTFYSGIGRFEKEELVEYVDTQGKKL